MISIEQFALEDNERAAVFEEFGFAGFSAQRLENHMTIVLALSLTLDGTFADLEAARAAHAKKTRISMGSVLKEMLPYIPSDYLKEQLQVAVERRNHLVHQFFREHENDELTQDGRLQMIKECSTTAGFFNDLTDTWLIPLVRKALDRIGQDPDGHLPGLQDALEEILGRLSLREKPE